VAVLFAWSDRVGDAQTRCELVSLRSLSLPLFSASRYDFVDFVGDAILMVVPQIVLSLSSSDELLILNHSCLELRSKCLALRLCVVVGRLVSERKPHVLFDWYLKTR
jgi:hypothetical protein